MSQIQADERPGGYGLRSAARTAKREGVGGRFSQILRQQMAIAMERNADPQARYEIQQDLEAMNAVDPDDAPALLSDIAQIEMGMLARITRLHASGQMKTDQYVVGVMALGEHARKILATRSAILGTSTDELESAVATALETMGLGGDELSQSPADQAIRVEAKFIEEDQTDGTLHGDRPHVNRA